MVLLTRVGDDWNETSQADTQESQTKTLHHKCSELLLRRWSFQNPYGLVLASGEQASVIGCENK